MRLRDWGRAILREALWRVHDTALRWWVALEEPRRGARRLADEPTYTYSVQFMGADGAVVDPPHQMTTAEPQDVKIIAPPLPQGAVCHDLYAGIGKPVYLGPTKRERARG